MLVKRYVVNEMPEAVAMIRQELGKDAVILSTKKIKIRGFLGLFPKTQIEVVAAANENDKQPERPRMAKPAAVVPPVQTVARHAVMGAYQQNRAVAADMPTSPELLDAPHLPSTPEEQEDVLQVAQSFMRKPTPSFDTPSAESTAAPSSPVVLPHKTEENPTVLTEVQEMRQLLRNLMNQSSAQLLPDAVQAMREQLLKQDLEIEHVDRLIEQGILRIPSIQDVDLQEFRVLLTNLIKEELEKVANAATLSDHSRVVSLIGPTGVGKTTSIAKIAAEQVLTRGKKVGLITTDTYRIAAVEQLRTYANILNVPLEVCYSPDDIKRALEKFEDRDLILADTAGRNYGNMLNVRELNTYLQALTPDETYLVLALTTKASDLDRIVDNFSGVHVDKFLFTKSDETSTYGAIYNLVSRYRIKLSYLTTGQNVPDDIEALSTDKLAGLLVGEKAHA